jgi:SHS2 domain-containing protein
MRSTLERGQTGFRILEHPSDLGIEASGSTIGEAFEQAALGLVAVIAEPETIEAVDERIVELDARDAESLLVRWLSDILYLYDGEHFLVKEAKIDSISARDLRAHLLGEKYQPKKHTLKLDVKAVTYHQLLIETKNGDTTVRVFLDI